MKLPCTLILVCALFAGKYSALKAKIPAKQWDKGFGGLKGDYLTSVVQTSDGGFIIGGSSDSGISGQKSEPARGPIGTRDYWVVRTDAAGNKLWDKTFGGSGDDQLYDLIQTNDGGYLLGGHSDSGIGGDSQAANGGWDFWAVKLDANGNKQWDKAFGGNSIERIVSLQQTPNGGYILGGWSASGANGDKTQPSQGGYDYWLLKTDSSGNKIWDKSYGGLGLDYFFSLDQTADGGYILGGYSDSDISGDKTSFSRGGKDYWVVKVDSLGVKQWDKTIGGSNTDYLYSLQQTTDGGYILGGESNSGISSEKSQISRGDIDFWVVKLNASGIKQWDKTFGGAAEDVVGSLTQTADGGYLVGGRSNSGISTDKTENPKGQSDFWLVRVDALGNKLWDKTIGGTSIDWLISLKRTSDGGYILGGTSYSWMGADKSQNGQGDTDYWIIKLGPDVLGVNDFEENKRLAINPNPSRGKFQLQLTGLAAKTVTISISDLLGRSIYQQELPVTGNKIIREIKLPTVNQMYLLQVRAGSQTFNRKIVVE